MSSRASVLAAGSAALRTAGRATVFASFERSCYLETPAGIACMGAGIGLGPLNMIVEGFAAFPVGTVVDIDVSSATPWQPSAPGPIEVLPDIAIPESITAPAEAFLDWLAGEGAPDDSLIGLGPGLTPAGDDFVGGAMIALRAYGKMAGHAALADRVAAWALPLAERHTNRISRAHLACAAAGEGHEFLHGLLCAAGSGKPPGESLARLACLGHTSGLDAAAGAVLALGVARRSGRDPRPL